MNDSTMLNGYGVVSEPATLTIKRLLPGPIERVWSYFTDSNLRRRWLASGKMTLEVGAPFEFVWKNNELTDPPGRRPEGMSGEHRLESRITEVDAPNRLGFSWGDTGGVTIQLEQKGNDVLLTVTHSRVTERSTLLGVSLGWHKHLDLLAEVLAGGKPSPFWDGWDSIKAEYNRRIPAAPEA